MVIKNTDHSSTNSFRKLNDYCRLVVKETIPNQIPNTDESVFGANFLALGIVSCFEMDGDFNEYFSFFAQFDHHFKVVDKAVCVDGNRCEIGKFHEFVAGINVS